MPGEVSDGNLCRPIVGVAAAHRPSCTRDRAYRDNLAQPLLLHGRGNGIDRVDGPERVHPDDKLPQCPIADVFPKFAMSYLWLKPR